MKRAILSDIHANLEALTAVLADAQRQDVEQFICLGDIVGYGPNPRECIDLIMKFDACILGNHDLAALFDPEGFSSGAEHAIFWTRQQLEDSDQDPEQARRRLDFLAQLPRTHREDRFLFVHGSPRQPLNEYVFPEDVFNRRKTENILAAVEQFCFHGHTHVPGVISEDMAFSSPDELDNRYVFGKHKAMINVGSVGQPRDNDPRSCYVVLDDEAVWFRRVDYPKDLTAAKIHSIDDLDDFLGDRLLEGR